MGGADSPDALVRFYQTDVCSKLWYWPHCINTVDALISVTFKVFKLVISDVKVDFLIFTRLVAMHYLKAAKVWK